MKAKPRSEKILALVLIEESNRILSIILKILLLDIICMHIHNFLPIFQVNA